MHSNALLMLRKKAAAMPLGYVLLAGVLYAGMILSSRYLGAVPRLAANTVLILAFVLYILRKDLPVRNLPVIGKYFR